MRRIKLRAGVLAIMMAIGMLAACAADRSVGPGGPASMSAMSVVTGVVDTGPACPGPARLDSPCPPRPLPGAVVDVTRGGQAITSIVADSSGRFTVRLASGRYDFTAHNVGGLPSRATQAVTVPADHTVELTVDSGVR
jgi:hypothetical protein